MTLSTVNSAFVHCLQSHKLHFSITFLFKMGLTVLFTHLKIISLQCFQFQFSVSAKISSIQTHPLCPFLNKNLPFLFYIFTFQNTKHHKYQFFFIFLIIFFSHTTTIIHSFLIFEIRKEKKTKCKMNNVSVNLYGYCNINLFLHNFIWSDVDKFWTFFFFFGERIDFGLN